MSDIVLAALICTFGPFIGLLTLAFGLPLSVVFFDWASNVVFKWMYPEERG